MVPMNLSVGQQWRYSRREQTCGHGRRGRRRWDASREHYRNIAVAMCKIRQPVGICYVTGSSNPVLWDDPEGRDGAGQGGRRPEGGDTCKPTADSCGCMAGTNTVLQSSYPSIKNTFINT